LGGSGRRLDQGRFQLVDLLGLDLDPDGSCRFGFAPDTRFTDFDPREFT
jgi:hypothetical protein